MRNNITLTQTESSIGIKIRSEKKSKSSLNFLLIFSIIAFCLPVLFFILALSLYDNAVGFGFLISIILFWGSGLFTLKMFLWNRFGEEEYIFSNNKLTYIFNYRFFKSKPQELDYSSVEFGYHRQENNSELFALSFDHPENGVNNDVYFVIRVDENETLKSTIPVQYDDLKLLVKKLGNPVYPFKW